MPFANLKIPAGLLGPEQKRELIEKVTQAYVDAFGEGARPNTMVLVDEVVDGGWGVAGAVLTAEVLRG